MATIRNPLQEQLLKAGLARKSKVDQAARDLAKQRGASSAAAPSAALAEVERARQEKLERDRALSADRNAQARAQELRAQVRQIIEQTQLKPEGDIAYRFAHDGAIRTVLVDEGIRRQLATGALVIACLDTRYAVIPRAAAEKIEARDPALIALDHRRSPAPTSEGGDDEHYDRFKVPDDLIW
jgi:uncharacterized protein